MVSEQDAVVLSRAVHFLIEGRDDDARVELRGLSIDDPVPPPKVTLTASVPTTSEIHRPSVTPAQLAAVLKRDGWRCHYCGRLLVAGGVLELVGVLCPNEFPFLPGHHMPAGRTHPAANRMYPNVDHVHAGSRGGSWTKLDNLIAACTPCNERKGDRAGWTPAKPEATDWRGLIDCYRVLAERAGPIRRYHLNWFKALGV